jgi:hypothetical protein
MAIHSICESCGSRLSHLEGATGRVTFCTRCGWGRVELTSGERILAVGAGFARLPIRQRVMALEPQEG